MRKHLSGLHLDPVADKALAEGWQGQRLMRVARLYTRFDEPMPVDLQMHLNEHSPEIN